MTALDIFLLGILGGISPGPITALLLGETLKNGIRSGIQVPMAMFCSNLIFSIASVSLLVWGHEMDGVLKFLPWAGACLLIFLGVQEWRASGELRLSTSNRPFVKCFLIDLINPHPYLFWFTVLAPTIAVVLLNRGFPAAAWLGFLYALGLVGTKTIMVFAAHLIRPFLKPEVLRIVLKVLAALLVLFGLKLLLS